MKYIKKFENTTGANLVALKKSLKNFLNGLVEFYITYEKETEDEFASLEIHFKLDDNVFLIIDDTNHKEIRFGFDDYTDLNHLIVSYIKEIITNTNYNELDKCKFDRDKIELEIKMHQYNL